MCLEAKLRDNMALGQNSFQPMSTPTFLREQADGILVSIKLQPRASKNLIGQVMGDELRVHVTAPPVDAAANDALVRLLAETLDCPRNQIQLVRGHTSRHKTLKIYGRSLDEVHSKLSRAVTE